MKRYRLVDNCRVPYFSWYNSTDLSSLAQDICDILQPDDFIDPDWKYSYDKIYKGLLDWERDFIILVEESDEPFETQWEYWDEEWFNYSEEDIIKYASTREDLWGYDKDKLIDYVHSFSDKPLSEILDSFSMVDYKDELFDYLNNILFDKFDEVVDTTQKWFAIIKWVECGKADCVDLANEFVDWKELYDLDYND